MNAKRLIAMIKILANKQRAAANHVFVLDNPLVAGGLVFYTLLLPGAVLFCSPELFKGWMRKEPFLSQQYHGVLPTDG